jgi:hypothetical protein
MGSGIEFALALASKARPRGDPKEMKIKIEVEFDVTESGLEDALAEYDELTVEGLLREMLDKSVACDNIESKVVSGPNTLEEYDPAANS